MSLCPFVPLTLCPFVPLSLCPFVLLSFRPVYPVYPVYPVFLAKSLEPRVSGWVSEWVNILFLEICPSKRLHPKNCNTLAIEDWKLTAGVNSYKRAALAVIFRDPLGCLRNHLIRLFPMAMSPEVTWHRPANNCFFAISLIHVWPLLCGQGHRKEVLGACQLLIALISGYNRRTKQFWRDYIFKSCAYF